MKKNELNQDLKSINYSDAGVNIDAGEELVSQIGPIAKSTSIKGATGELGGFGGLFDLKKSGFKDPILVSSTDGVGTKLQLAIKVTVCRTARYLELCHQLSCTLNSLL